MLRNLAKLVASYKTRTTNITRRAITSRAEDTASEDDLEEGREWLARFTLDTIPKNICDVKCSRSSGPGGQNVNKFVIFIFYLQAMYINDIIHYCMSSMRSDFPPGPTLRRLSVWLSPLSYP